PRTNFGCHTTPYENESEVSGSSSGLPPVKTRGAFWFGLGSGPVHPGTVAAQLAARSLSWMMSASWQGSAMWPSVTMLIGEYSSPKFGTRVLKPFTPRRLTPSNGDQIRPNFQVLVEGLSL